MSTKKCFVTTARDQELKIMLKMILLIGFSVILVETIFVMAEPTHKVITLRKLS